jgi:ABC-2 type transport system permease protein
LKTLITALGVDYEQWKALVRAAIKLDLRTSTFGAERGSRTPSVGWRVTNQLLAYVVIGGISALMAARMQDPFLATTFVNTYVIFMVATAMLVDHSAAVISPDDYAILGFRPITSRTYFVSRLTNVLVYTLTMTTAAGLIPATVFFVRYGVLTGAVALIALFLCALTISLAIVVGYAALLRWVGARRLRNLLSYVQLGMGIVVYGGYFLFSDLFRNVPGPLSDSTTRWLMLNPAAWFASYAELAAGRADALHILVSLFSITLLAFLISRLRSRLSLEYSERLGALIADSATEKPRALASPQSPSLQFLRDETRAVAVLVRSHFRNDIKFRMGVLGVLPMTIVYLFMGLRDHGNSTTFTPSGSRLWMVTVPALLLPILLKTNLARSDAFRASWIFFATPADRTRLIVASRDVLVAFFLVPYLVLLGVAIAFFGVNPGYLLVYLTITGLLSHFALLLVMYIDPELPFAKPIEKTGSTGRLLVLMFVIGLFSALIPFVARLIYSRATMMVAILAAILAVTWLLNRMLRRRIRRLATHLEFQG